MCLAIPYRVIRIEGNSATVEALGKKKEVLIIDVKPKIGDYVIVKSNIVVKIVEKDVAEEFLASVTRT